MKTAGKQSQIETSKADLLTGTPVDTVTTCNMSETNITVLAIKDEARITSVVMAEQLGIQHKNVLELIDKYRGDFEQLGRLAFQTRKGEALPQGGFAKATRSALLNEDQAYLLLTFSRNTPQVRMLKIELVKAFARFRRNLQTEQDYLPFYHELHQQIKALAQQAHQTGSTTPEAMFHLNINRLINQALGIKAGQRHHLSTRDKAKIITAQLVASELLQQAIAMNLDHRSAYHHVKQGVSTFARACQTQPMAQVPAIKRNGQKKASATDNNYQGKK